MNRSRIGNLGTSPFGSADGLRFRASLSLLFADEENIEEPWSVHARDAGHLDIAVAEGPKMNVIGLLAKPASRSNASGTEPTMSAMRSRQT